MSNERLVRNAALPDERDGWNDRGAALWAIVHPILRSELRERVEAILADDAERRAIAELARSIQTKPDKP